MAANISENWAAASITAASAFSRFSCTAAWMASSYSMSSAIFGAGLFRQLAQLCDGLFLGRLEALPFGFHILHLVAADGGFRALIVVQRADGHAGGYALALNGNHGNPSNSLLIGHLWVSSKFQVLSSKPKDELKDNRHLIINVFA